MRSSQTLVMVMIAGIVACTASPASAIVVNVTTGQTLFRDDFESTVSVSTQPYKDESGDYNPASANPGTWTITETDPYWVQVTTSATAPDPGAYRGSKYLRLYRDARLYQAEINDPRPGFRLLLIARAGFAVQSKQGNDICMAQMVHIPTAQQTTRGAAQFVAGSGMTNCINVCANIVQMDGSVSTLTEDGWVDTGLDFTAGEWQLWQIDYKIGDPTFTLTIGSASASGLPVAAIADSLDSFSIHAEPNTGNPFYVDEVSESFESVPAVGAMGEKNSSPAAEAKGDR